MVQRTHTQTQTPQTSIITYIYTIISPAREDHHRKYVRAGTAYTISIRRETWRAAAESLWRQGFVVRDGGYFVCGVPRLAWWTKHTRFHQFNFEGSIDPARTTWTRDRARSQPRCLESRFVMCSIHLYAQVHRCVLCVRKEKEREKKNVQRYPLSICHKAKNIYNTLHFPRRAGIVIRDYTNIYRRTMRIYAHIHL